MLRHTTATAETSVTSQRFLRPARWTVIKHGGVAYLRGFRQTPLSPDTLRVGNITFANQAKAPTGYTDVVAPAPFEIEVRMDKIAGIVDNTYKVDETGTSYGVSDENWEQVKLSTVAADDVYTPMPSP